LSTYLLSRSSIFFNFVNCFKDLNYFIYSVFISLVPFFFALLIDLYKKNRYQKNDIKYRKKLKNVIISESHNSLFYEGKVTEGAKTLTKKVSENIGSDRCSIWLYNEDKTSIICKQLYVYSEDSWYSNIELHRSDFKEYFEHLEIDPIIIANDAETHNATSCFKDSYLRPLGIKSMLDVPIFYLGKVIGVICIESTKKRNWKDSEVNFAQMLSTLYSFAHSIKEGNKKSNQIKEMDSFIDESALVSKADKFGKITYVNKKFEDISGWKLDEVLGKDHSIVNSGKHPKEMWKDMYDTVINHKKIWNSVITNISKDGNLYYVDTFIKAEFDPETDELIGFTSIRQDVTDLKRKELDIRDRMNAINQSNLVIEFDKEGYIKFANQNFCESMGYKMKEVIGKHHSIFVEKEFSLSKDYEKFWQRLNMGQFVSSDFKRIKKDGSEIWLQATYNPIFDNEGNVVRIMKIATDVSGRIIQSIEIEKKNTYLEHASKIIRHDMHSGINTYIPRGISSLERRLTEDDIKNLKIEAPLKMVKEGLRHAQKVYRGVYEFTNLVKKDAVLNKENLNLKLILDDYLSSTAYKSQVDISDLGSFSVNESLFCTALDNLIRNGLKYNDSNNKLVKISRDNDIIYVEDNGRGLTSEEFMTLSKPYTRKEGQKETGTGLGLNICISILNEHGFSVDCEKRLEGGSRIKIKLAR
jgi:PAS domain S-box-containing protein